MVLWEDFELLLNGVAELKVEALKQLIRVKLKPTAGREMGHWFWEVVEDFTQAAVQGHDRDHALTCRMADPACTAAMLLHGLDEPP